MARTGLFYCRFMDDWVILSPTQARFRRAVATVNRVLHDLKVEKHPDKTFIGRISRGFDFFWYQFQKDDGGTGDAWGKDGATVYGAGGDDVC